MFFLFKTKSDGNGGSHVNRTPSQIKAIVGIGMSLAVAIGWVFNQAFAYTQLKSDVKKVCAESALTKARVDSMRVDLKVLCTNSENIKGDMVLVKNYILSRAQ
jgi:hypothetical protein